MSQKSKLPILEMATLTVVVLASAFAVLPGANEILVKMFDGIEFGTGVSDLETNKPADDLPQFPRRPSESQQLKVQSVAFPARVDQQNSRDFDQNRPAAVHELPQRTSANNRLQASNLPPKGKPKSNELSIDPFEELDDSEMLNMHKSSLDAEKKAVPSAENRVTTSGQDELDWELELDPRHSINEQASEWVDEPAPSHQPHTETADEAPARIMVPNLEPVSKAEVETPSSHSQFPGNPARLFDAVSPSVFERFDFDRGQIVVNRMLSDDPEIKLSATRAIRPNSANSVARIIPNAANARTQKNPTLGADFDWNQYIFSDLPANGSARRNASEKLVRAPSQTIPNPGEQPRQRFQQLPPQNRGNRHQSVLVPTPASSVERVSRQPMSSQAMQQDNSFRPIR